MHDDEVRVEDDQVRRLLAGQLPQWADLPLRRLAHDGTDHAMFRLGADLCVRLPRIHWAVATLEREHRWLPRLAPYLPTETPVPVALGAPGEGYPWPWTVCRWVDGENPRAGGLADPAGTARELAGFVRALRGVPVDGAPPTVWTQPLHEENPRVAESLRAVGALPEVAARVDLDAVRRAWRAARDASPCASPTWIHGDLAPGNLLLRDGRLRGVIDFSAAGVGDPASDLRPGWNLLDPVGRSALRDALDVDDATWARARGWVLLQALVQLPYYTTRNPPLAGQARRVLEQVEVDVRAGEVS